MRSISMARARGIRPRDRAARSRAFAPSSSPIEALEPRQLPSALGTSAPVEMISATTHDSQSVTIRYQVNQPIDASAPLRFGVYRSTDGRFSADDATVDAMTVVPPGVSGQAATLDDSGNPAGAVGVHTMTIAIPGGLPPVPRKPYVTVVADPNSSTATTDPQQAASFRVYTIGVVTHGGIQDPSWKHGPPWELEIAYMMRRHGFDAVIPYNWALQSSTAGSAIKQSPRLARIILATANRMPANAVVDLELIGHSEGTVVNAYALRTLQGELTPSLQAGYVQDILLDPHAANNDVVSGKQMSFNGPLAGLANMVVTDYQGRANDPPAYVPSIVDQADVFFQHSSSTPGAIYNLWGQVPVRSEGPTVHYYNLTAMGATHSGKTGVNYWFRDFMAPTLGNGAPLIRQLRLSAHIDGARTTPSPTPLAQRAYGPEQVVASGQPQVSGTSAPGSIVRLLVGPVTDPSRIGVAGVTHADASGRWTVTPRRPLPAGQYRVVVSAFSTAMRTRPGLAVVPTQPLGRLVVNP